MNRQYNIGNHLFEVTGETLLGAIDRIEGFRYFISDSPSGGDSAAASSPAPLPEFTFSEGEEHRLPSFSKEDYSFRYEEVTGTFGRSRDSYLLRLAPEKEQPLWLWTKGTIMQPDGDKVYLYGNYSLSLLRFALWVGYGIMTARTDTVAVHSSCIVYREKAVLFLGESGTGKSTHTHLWRENIPGCELLNDDSPVVRCEQGQIRVYGSPWSGKTPCYKAASYPLAGCVRLSQAPHNSICRLDTLQAYAALHPSFPPEFAYDECLYDGVSALLSTMLCSVPVYHLECLPDGAAAKLACHTLYGGAEDDETTF